MGTMITDYNNPFLEKPKTKKKTIGQRLTTVAEVIAGLSFLAIVLYLFVFTPHQVKGPSMEGNFYTDQILLVNRLYQVLDNTPFGQQLGLNFNRGDVVVFHKSGFEDAIVKRIIGLPGDTVGLNNGRFYVNGSLIEEKYLPEGFITNPGDFLGEGDVKTVPQDHFFLSGDNRPHSIDSRFQSIGFVSRSEIAGKVVIRLWPAEDFSLIGTGPINFL